MFMSILTAFITNVIVVTKEYFQFKRFILGNNNSIPKDTM